MADDTMEKIVSLAKRRGFVYPGSEIYGGLSGTWDYGPLGVELKNNIKQLWWRTFVQEREDMCGLDAAILMSPRAWEASGHVAGFSDPLVECTKCKRRFRADHVETFTEEGGLERMKKRIKLGLELGDDEVFDSNKKEVFWICGNCGAKNFGSDVRQFNMMFKTHVGAAEDEASVTYLRPETAGGIFVNFKNVWDSVHPKLPFGIAQIGKAFRNEIAPRDFIFRVRELEQMEIEYFVRPDVWKEAFDAWQADQLKFAALVGIDAVRLHQITVAPEDRAHYSSHSVDTEFDFPFGQKELWGLAYRGDFDLSAHAKHSGQNLAVSDTEGEPAFLPHVVEPTFGVERTLLAILTSAYTEDELGGEPRTYLKFTKAVAPIKVAVFPLLKNKPDLVAKARAVYATLKKDVPQIMWDDNGNIGKRYRRQDEIGTPSCVTVDFQTLEDDTVTVRDRDSGAQERVEVDTLSHALQASQI